MALPIKEAMFLRKVDPATPGLIASLTPQVSLLSLPANSSKLPITFARRAVVRRVKH